MIWSRAQPQFFASESSRIYAPAEGTLSRLTTQLVLNPTSNSKHRVLQKSKVLKLVIDPSKTNGKVQLDSIGILGFSLPPRVLTECPGKISVDVFDTANQLVAKRDVFCSGKGSCKPSGCMCEGNWSGAACSVCAYGYEGENCEDRIINNDESTNLCTISAFEDLSQFATDELLLRWRFVNYKFMSSAAVIYRHYGTRMESPLVSLASHSHVRIRAGFFVVDNPNQQSSGIEVRVANLSNPDVGTLRGAVDQASSAERTVFIKRVPYNTGINLVGTGTGDSSETMDINFDWPYDNIAVSFHIWSPDRLKTNYGNHRLTISYLSIDTCSYPSASGSGSPDPDFNG